MLDDDGIKLEDVQILTQEIHVDQTINFGKVPELWKIIEVVVLENGTVPIDSVWVVGQIDGVIETIHEDQEGIEHILEQLEIIKDEIENVQVGLGIFLVIEIVGVIGIDDVHKGIV